MMMMDVRELVTKFSFQVNSTAVKNFIGLLAEAETSLDNLGKKTTINAGKARVEGEKRTQKQIEAIQKRWDKRKNDRLKLAVKEQQKIDKQQLSYEERRSKVLSALSLSRVKRRIEQEKQANKLIAKQQVDANKAVEKQQKFEKQAREKQNKDFFRALKQSRVERERYQKKLETGSQSQRARMLGMFGGKYKFTGSEDLVAHAKKIKFAYNKRSQLSEPVLEELFKGLSFKLNKEQSKRLREIQQGRTVRSSSSDFDRAFRPKASFSPKETGHIAIPNLFAKTEKSLSKELDALFKPMAKFQNKVADNQILVEKRTQREIANIQKRWDDRKNKRQSEEYRYQQWLQRGSLGEKSRMAGMFSGVYGARLKQNIATNKELNALRNPSMPKAPTGKSGSGFSLADTYFNVQLLKDAYQLFYNIAEATRQTVVNVLRTNDALSMSIAKIGVITGDTKNASKNFKELLDISAETGSEIGAIEEIFNRLSIGKEGLGATTDQIIDFTSAIAKMSAFSESGAAQQGALRQLGQMFGGAYIQAQEWNSIVDGLPMVASKIAKAMGTTREAMTFKIRQQTKDSPAYLISDIFPALLKILPEIEAEFNKLPPTLDRTLNKAGVGLLKFSLNLKESVKMPELDAFYSNLDKTVAKVFEWANANKALIGTNINIFFKNLNALLEWFMVEISKPEDINIFTRALKETKDVLKSINTVLENSKPIATALTSPAGILALSLMKQTLDALISPLTLISALIATISSGWNAIDDFNTKEVIAYLKDRRKLGTTTDQLRWEGYSDSILDKAGLLAKPTPYVTKAGLLETPTLFGGAFPYGNDVLGKAGLLAKPTPYGFAKNPQASFGNKGGGVTIIQNNNFKGGSATPSQQKQTASLVGGSASHGVRKAIQKGSVGH